MSGWQWLGLISPVFVFCLLRFGSGIPILERRSDEKFGKNEAYQAYKARTPLLLLLPPK
jgi:steroid 5-alpha reductase family enzyme